MFNINTLKLNIILTISLLVISLSSTGYSDTYKWVDDQGDVHYSDDYYSIPEGYRNRIKEVEVEDRSPSLNNRRGQGIGPPQSEPTNTGEEDTPVGEGGSSENTTGESSQQTGSGASPKDSLDIDDIKDSRAVTIIDGISPKIDRTGNTFFSGKVKNNTKYTLRDIEISFHLYDSTGKTIDVVNGQAVGAKKGGILEGGEIGDFNIETFTPYTKVRSYKYFITWKGFK